MALFRGRWRVAVSMLAVCTVYASTAKATPALVVDVDSGNVLYQSMATAPWFPASLTKLMTTYVALSAVREGRLSLNTPFMVSARAASMAPSKMGFKPGTLVTLDNALKMLMVKSPNDIAVTIAEGISGSVEAFADEMNNYAARLGLHESHFSNPNGLPDPSHVSSARDMGIIARALLREFPEQHELFGIGVLAFGSQLIRNHNNMLGRYPGVDGMKTGYTCSAGYNVVLSAQRDNRRLITVVMGAPSLATRSQKAASLFDRYFAGDAPSQGSLAGLPSEGPALAPDLRSIVCGRGRANAIAEAEAEDGGAAAPAVAAATPGGFSKGDVMERGGTAPATTGPSVLRMPQVAFTPVRVFVGPVDGWTGPIAHAKGMEPVSNEVAKGPPPATASKVAITEDAGAKEAPSPAPMALLGATAPTPAALVTRQFARKSKPLSLAVRPAKRVVRPSKHDKADKAAIGHTPSILASGATSAAKDTKVAPAPTVKPKPKKVVPAKKSATE